MDIPVNTMETAQGANIDIPYGNQTFRVAFNTPLQYNELLSRTNDFLLNFLFIFELYD
jgi:hypothetical protein